jgi:hypothetical protein
MRAFFLTSSVVSMKIFLILIFHLECILKKFFLILCLLPLISWADSSLIYQARDKGIDLKEEDQKVLSIGEISTARYIVGGILGTYPVGLGIGHAIQGRWSEDGWVFTAGEVGSLSLVVAGIIGCVDQAFEDSNCSNLESAFIVTGAIGFVGFRIWEIADVWSKPPMYNNKYRDLKKYIETSPSKKTVRSSLDLSPLVNSKLGNGLVLSFNF